MFKNVSMLVPTLSAVLYLNYINSIVTKLIIFKPKAAKVAGIQEMFRLLS